MLSQLLLVNYNLPLSFFMIMLIRQIRLELTLQWDCMQSALKDICPDKKLVKSCSVSGWVTNRFRNSDFLLSGQGHRTWNDQVKSNSRHHHGKLIKILISQCLKPPLHQFPWQWHSHWKHYVKKKLDMHETIIKFPLDCTWNWHENTTSVWPIWCCCNLEIRSTSLKLVWWCW